MNRSLSLLTLSNNTAVSREFLLPKKDNGFFTNDGLLYYDNENQKILYMYFYRGEFLSLDTNLNLKYKSKTIDTVKDAKIKTGLVTIRDKTSQTVTEITPIAPPKIINKYFTTNGNKVYLLSLLKSDNESKLQFLENQPVDIYDINSGRYLKSFYIPKYKGEKVNEFQIKENLLIAIYPKNLVAFRFTD